MLASPALTLEDEELQAEFDDILKRIERARATLDSHRDYSAQRHEHRRAEECEWVCRRYEDPNDVERCQLECAAAPLSMESIEKMEADFPICVKRLREDPELRRAFERYQLHPSGIGLTLEDALNISDIFAMPIASVVLSELAWERAMNVVKHPEFREQLDRLVRNWQQRATHYPAAAQEELTRKIQRHDTDRILSKALKKHRPAHHQ